MPIVRPTTKPQASFSPYDSRFPKVAQLLIDAIHEEAAELLVEHIGSTAVVGCAGKGIIDLMVVYPTAQSAVAEEALKRLGFVPQGPEFRHRDAFPDGHLVRIGELDFDGETFRAYVHAIPEGSDEIERFRLFRDRLNKQLGLRHRYVELKRRVIQDGVTDTDEYVVRKIEIIKEILGDDPG